MTPFGGERTKARVRLRDGSQVEIRPIGPDDRGRLSRAFAGLSDRSRYLRFQAPMADLSDRQLSYLTEVDHHDHEALVALDDAGDVIGVARFVRVDPEAAEFAIVVADQRQGQGLGSELLDRLVDRAREEDVRRFNAVVLAENADAIRLIERLGDAAAHRSAGPQVEFEVDLPERGRPNDRMLELLRAAAGGAVVPGVSMWRLVADFAYRGRRPAPAQPANAIVVEIDPADSDHAAAATRVARGLAAARGAHLHLVGSYRPLLSDRDAAAQTLNRTAAALREDGLAVSVHLRRDEAADALIDVAQENAAALIVLGPESPGESPGGLMPWRRYSLTDRVCARAPCDVLVAR